MKCNKKITCYEKYPVTAFHIGLNFFGDKNLEIKTCACCYHLLHRCIGLSVKPDGS